MHIEKRSTEVSRCKCQTLLDQTAVLSAMTYVDLNPIRAQICDRLEDSLHTSARARLDTIEKDPTRADQPLAPVLGVPGLRVLAMSQRNYCCAPISNRTACRIICRTNRRILSRFATLLSHAQKVWSDCYRTLCRFAIARCAGVLS